MTSFVYSSFSSPLPGVANGQHFARLAALLGMLLWLCACGAERTQPPQSGGITGAGATAAVAPAQPPLLLISLDGFRHDYRHRVQTPNMARLAAEGVSAAGLVHVFPTKTFVTHWSMVTGLYAGKHGVVANNMWDPARDQTFGLGDRDAVSDAYWYGGEPIWLSAERQGLTAATFFWPGSEAPVGGSRPTYWQAYDGSVKHAERIQQVLAWLDLPPAERPDFLTLYFSRVDSIGHRYGPDAKETAEAVAELDKDLGLLLEGLEQRGLLGAMNIVLVSDHGMSAVDPERTIWLEDYLPIDRVRISDSGPAAQIWASDLPADAIIEALQDAHPKLRVWRRGQTPAHYGFSGHARIPDVVAEADHGWTIAPRRRPSLRDLRPPRGMHGWDPLHREMHGLFIAHGPAFRPGESLPLVRSVDLYSLMAQLLAIDPAQTDGSLAGFAPLLREAPAAAGSVLALPALYGARHPDVAAAVPLASALADPTAFEGAVLTVRGQLTRECAGDVCAFTLTDGERELPLDFAAVPTALDALAQGDAVLAGTLQLRSAEQPESAQLHVQSLLVTPAR